MIRLDTIGPYLLAQKKSAHAKAGLTLSLLTQRQGVYHTLLLKIKGLFDSFFSKSAKGFGEI